LQEINIENITTDPLIHPVFLNAGLSADVLRLDKIHPIISGNKWFKLRFYLDDFKISGKKEIVTFGGAWSNHIVATAALCHQLGIKATGMIRGEKPKTSSQTLIDAAKFGMHLEYMSRTDYKGKQLPENFNDDKYFLIPEGGYGKKGMLGAATILELINKNRYTHICCAAGTGTMAAGLLHAALPGQSIEVVSVLKNFTGLEDAILSLKPDLQARLHIHHEYHIDGYAKYNKDLIDFMNDFFKQTSISSDFVYSAKMFFGISDLVHKKYFLPQSRLLLIHCGGLQGNVSLGKGTLIF
jgi:1-aminocyclopropane-1-carboxylate deaminase